MKSRSKDTAQQYGRKRDFFFFKKKEAIMFAKNFIGFLELRMVLNIPTYHLNREV